MRPCASWTVATPRRSSVAIAPASARWMLRTAIPFMSAGSGNSARFQELLERLAAKVRHHLRVGHAHRAPELLQAEEVGAVVLHRLPVEAAHHVLLLLGERNHRGLRVLLEELSFLGRNQRMQKPVQPQPLGTALEVEEVAHSNSATVMAVVIGR